MEKEIIIPENVTVEVQGKTVKIKGEKGELEKTFKYFFDIKIEKKDNKILISSTSERRKVKAMLGTIIAHIKNMINGATKGYEYKLAIVYSHFPMNVKVEGNKILITNFLGEKKPRSAKIVGDTKIEIKGQEIIVSGVNKEDTGQTAANMETACKVTKYDRRIFQDSIVIKEKGK